MSEMNASVRKDTSIHRRSSQRRSRRQKESPISQEALNAKRDEELRAKVRIKLADQTHQQEPEAKHPQGPRIQGRATSSEELQNLLNEKKRQERNRQTQRFQYEQAVNEKARAKISARSSELLQEPPETSGGRDANEEPAELTELSVLADPEDTADLEGEMVRKEAASSSSQKDTAANPPRASQRLTNRSVILRVGKRDSERAAGSQRVASSADQELGVDARPRKTRFIFKIAGVLLLLFSVLLGVRWVAMGKPPSDLVTVEGQRELAHETQEAVSAIRTWAQGDLITLAGGQVPESEADSARLVEESKVFTEGAEKGTPTAAKAEPTRVSPKRTVADSKPATPKPTRTAPSAYAQGRNADSLGLSSAQAYPWLAPARDAFAQANVYYAQCDPRNAAYDAIQKNIRLARPLLERCLDECDKARRKGHQGGELDSLEQNAAMRLYDCNKRATVK